MSDSLFLLLSKGTVLKRQAGDQIAVHYGESTLTFNRISPGNMKALERLGGGGDYEDRLTEIVLHADGPQALPLFYFYLQHLDQWRLLGRSVHENGQPIATLHPISSRFEYASRTINSLSEYRLSRFAYVRAVEGETILESPLSHARISLNNSQALVVVHALARPRRMEELSKQSALSIEATGQLTMLLLNAGLLAEATVSATFLEDENPSLQSWEFHDLLFHSRSRMGRHDHPFGATYRFVNRLQAPAAVRTGTSKHVIDLYRPDLKRRKHEDPPYALVQETRRSIRDYGTTPITAEQLGEFLYRVARVTRTQEGKVPTPQGAIHMDFAHRPYPGGGALYELELYLVIRSCKDLDPGLYHYAANTHQLERISSMTSQSERLLLGASRATTITAEHLQVLIIVAARFQRVSWKYSSMAYALTLKHVGVLYQTMYLVATAMELAPCAAGGGDADLFASAAGTDYYEETSVGEFLLGSKPNV